MWGTLKKIARVKCEGPWITSAGSNMRDPETHLVAQIWGTMKDIGWVKCEGHWNILAGTNVRDPETYCQAQWILCREVRKLKHIEWIDEKGRIFWMINWYDQNCAGSLTMVWGVAASCSLDLTVSPWGLLAPKVKVVPPVPWRKLLWGENWVFWGEMRHTGRSGEKTAPSFPTCTRGGNVYHVPKKWKWESSPWKRLNLLESDNVELALCTWGFNHHYRRVQNISFLLTFSEK